MYTLFRILIIIITTFASLTTAFLSQGNNEQWQQTRLAAGFGKSSAKKTRKVKDKTSEITPPVLDKWGLPPPTEHDIFPPLPPGTELIPASDSYNLEDIKVALKDHISLDLSNFDSNGREIISERQDQVEPMQLRLLHKSPPVLAIDNFFTKAECKEVENVTETRDGLIPLQVDSKTFSPLSLSVRTSTSWFCHFAQLPTLVAKAQYRLGIHLEHMEEPQIVRYQIGQEFSWHYDEVPSAQLKNGGQRLATLLVYLNTVSIGGGTIFRDLVDDCSNNKKMLTVQPRQGTALLFFPAFANGKPDDRTLHKGEVAQSEKRIVQMWIHEREYKPVTPPGNSHEAAIDAVERIARELGYIE